MTLFDALADLYKTYGYFKESVKSYALEGKAGIERIGGAMVELRENPPEMIGGVPVRVVEDLLSGERKEGGQTTPIELPRSNVLRYFLDNGAWVCVRPSGTEPKLKLYIGANAEAEVEVDALLETLTRSADELLTRYLGQDD